MWADNETDVDYLNYSEVAEMIADLLCDDAMLPTSVGVFGSWGVGKSSVLKLVARRLATDKKNQVIHFDAWLYQDFDAAKAALMSVIAADLYTSAPEGLKDKARDFIKRTNKMRALGLAVDLGAAAWGIPTMGVFSKAAGSIGDAFSGTADEEDVKQVREAASEAKSRLEGLVEGKKTRSPPEEIHAFREELRQLLESLDRRLVVFVDNLDRCLPPNAIQTLEAMRLFLFLPRTAFVVAADEDMIRHAVAKHFSDPTERHVSDYLDKLIQVPVYVPKLGLQEVRAYLFMLVASRAVGDSALLEELRSFLVAKLRRSWADEPPFSVDDVMSILASSVDDGLRRLLETANRIAGILAFSQKVNGNPRIVKRLLNVIRMRASVARRREMNLDEAVIAKLALFERCTDAEALKHLHGMISSAGDGKSADLAALEKAENLEAKCPKAWAPYQSFVADWLRLDPPLGGIDLKPAVYLSRETLPLRFEMSSLSQSTKSAIQVLLKTTTLNSRASREAAESIDVTEAAQAMSEIVDAMRRNDEWGTARDDMRGAILLADKVEATRAILARFLTEIPKKPAWLQHFMKTREWLSQREKS